MDQKTNAAVIRKRIAWIVSGVGTAVLLLAYALWIARENPSVPGILAAGLSLALFTFGCWRFVPGWIAFFEPQKDLLPNEKPPKHAVLGIAALAFAVEVLTFGVVTMILSIRNGSGFTFEGALNFWRCLDSNHYLDITREWYVPKSFLETTEEWFQNGDDVGRVVQLVFLPGYPLAVYPVYRILGNDVIAGLLVSAAAFPAACCMLYKLLMLDVGHKTAFRAVVMLLLLPGGFFFLAPMSESLYLLLALSTLYCFRKKRFLPAGLLGAYCAFTRTVGLLLVAPLILEWIRTYPKKKKQRGFWFEGLAAILAVPVGFLAYLWINKTVSGNALQFLTYQHRWWSQHLGWFFNTASYQTEYLLGAFRDGARESAFGLWLPNLVWHFGTLVLFALTAKKLRPSCAAWFIAFFVIAIGATWLLSGPRYLLSMPVTAMMLALVTEKRWQKITAACVLAPLSAFYLYAFVARWQVW
ncbi:MAG: hypothetical protein IJJ86_05470 [Clostridia bacterium]|nr:hypothetical protein [Clostridia bacterium]